MAKCKYPNEVCANMTVLHGATYCDGVPCELKDELPKQTNADRIRNMTDEELAKLLQEAEDCGYRDASITPIKDGGYMDMLEWLQAEAKEGNSNENT